MSRIGKQPIVIPEGTEVKIENRDITVKGKKGELKLTFHPKVKVKVEENQIVIERSNDEKFSRSLHGLTRSLINNMVIGVNEGFKKELEIQGVGYKAQVQGKKVILNLGYSHVVEYPFPEDINISMDQEKKNVIIIEGSDKQKVGQIASEIREFRKPEPYKGKGIRYVGEYIIRKAGKTAASGGGD